MQVEGAKLEGVHYAMEFLQGAVEAAETNAEAAINSANKRVIVIGAGDTVRALYDHHHYQQH